MVLFLDILYISNVDNFRLQHKDVFDFIRKHNLHSTIIQKLIIPLLDLNRTEAINLLMERQIAPDIIIEQLEQRLQPEYLYLVCP